MPLKVNHSCKSKTSYGRQTQGRLAAKATAFKIKLWAITSSLVGLRPTVIASCFARIAWHSTGTCSSNKVQLQVQSVMIMTLQRIVDARCPRPSQSLVHRQQFCSLVSGRDLTGDALPLPDVVWPAAATSVVRQAMRVHDSLKMKLNFEEQGAGATDTYNVRLRAGTG